METDTRWLAFLIWGGGTFTVYSVVLTRRVLKWRRWHDRRAVRDLLEAFALWLAALGSAAATAFVLFGQAGTTLRSAAIALALGAFLGAGIVMVSEDDGEKEQTE